MVPDSFINVFVPDRNEDMYRKMHPNHFLNLLDFLGREAKVRVVHDSSEVRRRPTIYPVNLGSVYRLSDSLAKIRGEPFCVYDGFDKAVAREVQQSGGMVVLDLSVEAYFPSETIVRALYEGIEDVGLNPARVCLINSNMTSRTMFEDARALLGSPSGPQVLPFHGCYWLLVKHNRASLSQDDERLEARIRSAERTLHGAKRSHKFVTFNGRVRPHRIYTVLWLLAQGHFKNGLVSMVAFEKDDAVLADRMRNQIVRLNYPDQEHLLSFLPELVAKLPLSIDVAAKSYFDSVSYKAKLPWESPDPAAYDSAYISIVIDTSFADNGWLFLTPIAYKSLMNLSPFLYVGNPRALQEMRRLGFQTFSPLIDECYDEETHHMRRMALILAELSRLLEMSPGQLRELYCELWPRLLHNFRHLHYVAPNQFASDFRGRILKPMGPGFDV